MAAFRSLHQWVSRTWKWFESRAHGHHARFWLFMGSCVDSGLLFFPPEIMMTAILVAGSKKWIYYAGLTTVASVTGALFGYFLGALFFDGIGTHIIELLNFEGTLAQVENELNQGAFVALMIAAFAPIPMVPFVYAAGFLEVNIFIFTSAVIIGRSARFFIMAGIVRAFGEQTLKLVERYANIATIIAIIALAIFLAIEFNLFSTTVQIGN